MAVTDLLVIITAVMFNRIPATFFPGSFLFITPVCSISTASIYASRDCSVWLTVTFTFDRFVAICCRKLKATYCTEKSATLVIGVVCALGCLINIPWYFIHEPIYKIENIPWYCRIKAIRYSSVTWRAFDWIDRILTPCLPFFLIILFNALTVRHIVVANRARTRIVVRKSGYNRDDPELENRKKSVILIFSISGSFILLWMTYFIQFLLEQVTNDYILNGFSDPKFIFRESSNMLQLLSCCTNTFIYAVTQSKFRVQLINMVQQPFILLRKLFK
ncbi:G-protein coupled receptor 15-like [Rhincodon typus]|uniref:G-protein coupled receptor 15-like n=1 Tax=Rhincodon typus TaxID=259920 RepID=UPI00202E1165|nr:G-protein coupled receptor 15-like [Rhincodon typus]